MIYRFDGGFYTDTCYLVSLRCNSNVHSHLLYTVNPLCQMVKNNSCIVIRFSNPMKHTRELNGYFFLCLINDYFEIFYLHYFLVPLYVG